MKLIGAPTKRGRYPSPLHRKKRKNRKYQYHKSVATKLGEEGEPDFAPFLHISLPPFSSPNP